MAEQNDKFKRVKYLRGLEKFAKAAISALKREDFNEDEFRARVGKNAKILRKIEPVFLDNAYSKSLENFVNLVVKGGERAELIACANALEKLKNQKTYKKEKHRKKYKDEE